MAIAHVHTDTTGDLNAPGATFALTLPTGGLSSEICILALASSRSTGSPVGTWSLGAGWTSMFAAFSQNQTVGTLGLQAFWSLANNANLTATKSGTVDFAGWVAVDFSGVDTTTPIDVTPNTQGNAGAASLTVASVTIITNQAWDLIIGCDWNSGVFTITNFTVSENAHVDEATGVCYNTTPKSVGATGTASFVSSASGSGQALAAARAALRPTGASDVLMAQACF